MKNLIENESLENAISFENCNISVKREILENVSIGIFGEKNQKNFRLKKTSSKFRIFCKNFRKSARSAFCNRRQSCSDAFNFCGFKVDFITGK